METTEENEKRELRELEGKNIQHYMVLLNAWITTKMEYDKTLITLSAAAIGLLITILTTKNIAVHWHIYFYACAFVGYLVTISSSLIIYQRNSLHIEKELREKGGHDSHLARLDKLSLWSFILGTIAFVSIGVLSATYKITEAKIMADDKRQTQQSSMEKVERSLNGINNLRPTNSQSQGGTNSGQGQSQSSSTPKK